MTYNNRIIVSCCNPTAKSFPFIRCKVLFCSTKYIGCRIKLVKFTPELFHDMIWNYKHGFRTHPKPFRLHRNSYHLKGLSRPYFMCKQGIPSKKSPCYCILLMWSKLNFRIYPVKGQIASVILP